MRFRQWGAGTVLGLALFTSGMVAILYHISMIGIQKFFGPLGSGATIAVYALFAVVALVTVLSIPLTLFLGTALLFTSARKSGFGLFCALSACGMSIADILFWLFYCGGIPGTAQRPFP